MKITFIALLLLLSFAYISLSNVSSSIEFKPIAHKLTLDIFSGNDVPDSLWGAGCAYSENKQDFDSNRLILSFPLGWPNYAVIKVNNAINILKGTSNNEPYDYSNGTYSITIQTSSGKSLSDEQTEDTGKMIIKNKYGQSLTVNLYGSCGD